MQSIADKTINKQKEELLSKIRTLADQSGWVHGSRIPYATLIKIVSGQACEKKIMQKLENNRQDVTPKFDPYYIEKSQFATAKIIDSIKTQLSTSGLEARILTEVPFESGRYDIVVTLDNPLKVGTEGFNKIKIEIKGSLGLDLEQIGRYLWDFSPLILVRVVTGHVTRIRPSELQSYVTFSLDELEAKVDRLASGKLFLIQGTDCIDCLDNGCVYWPKQNKRNKSSNVVTFSDIEFADDLRSFFQNLPYVANRTAIMVVEELQGFLSSRKQVFSPFPQN